MLDPPRQYLHELHTSSSISSQSHSGPATSLLTGHESVWFLVDSETEETDEKNPVSDPEGGDGNFNEAVVQTPEKRVQEKCCFEKWKGRCTKS